jgi:signal peptidase II
MNLTKNKFLTSKYAIVFWVALLGTLFDRWTKHWVHSTFRFGQTKDIIPNVFAYTYVRNRGAAFSFLDNAPAWFRDPFFLTLPIVALIIIGVLIYRLPESKRLNALTLSLIATGAIGNFIDRIKWGYVVDFIDVHWKEVYHYPRFNIADSCIVVGVGIMFVMSFFKTDES